MQNVDYIQDPGFASRDADGPELLTCDRERREHR